MRELRRSDPHCAESAHRESAEKKICRKPVLGTRMRPTSTCPRAIRPSLRWNGLQPISDRTVAAPPGCPPLAHWQNSDLLLALGTPGSDESGDALKSCPGHVGSQFAQISVAPWPGLINPVLSCCNVRCLKRHKR